MKYNKTKYLIVDFFMAFIAVFGVVMLLPMLPSIQSIFGVSVSQISWLPNLGYLTMILFAIIGGRVINRAGFKSLLIMSLLTWIAGIVIEMFALNSLHYYIFVFGRFIEGIGEAVIFPILLSMNKVVFKDKKDEKLGSSLVEFGGAVGGLISAILAGKFINFPKHLLFIPVAIAIISMIFIAFSIKNEALEIRDDLVQGVKTEESLRSFLGVLVTIFVIQIIFSSIQVYLAYYMEVFALPGLTGIVLSLEQILVALGTIVPIFLMKHISFKGIRNMIVLGFIFGVLILALQISVYISIAAVSMIAFFVGVGFTTLNIHLSKVIQTNISQKVSVYTSIRNMGGFVLSLYWGKFIEIYRAQGLSYGIVFKQLYTSAGIIVTVMFIAIILLQREEKSISITENRGQVLIEEV